MNGRLLHGIKLSFIKYNAINKAKRLLIGSPYDIFHNLKHHESVWNGCREIIREEKLQVDEYALEIASYWHDVFKGQGDKEALLLEKRLHQTRIPNETIMKIIKIISEHSFGKVQTLEESKVLFDADKIELVSTQRWAIAFDAYAKNEISIEIRDKYIKEWNRRMPLLEGNLHYKNSNRIFANNLRRIRLWLKSIGKLNSNGEFISEIS